MELSRSGDEEAVLNFREAQHLLNIVDIELGLPVSNESPDSGNLAASSQNAARSASLDSSRLYILAHDSLRQARLQEAETYFRESLALDAKFLGPEHPANATTLINLAALCAATSRTLEAFDLWDEVTSLDDYLLDQHLVLASGPERDQFFTGLREHLNSPLALARETLAEPVELPMAYCSYLDVLPPWCDRRKANPVPAHRKASILAKCRELVLKRKSVQLEVDLAVRGGLAGQQLGRLQPLAKELASVRWQLARSTDGWPEAIRPTADDGKRLRARLEELEKELRRALPTRWLADLLDGVSCHAIAAALPPDSALVEFVVIEPREFQIPPSREGPGFIIERRYLAFIIPAGQPDAIRLFDLGKKASIDLDIVWFRASITGERDVVSSDGGVFVGGRMKNTEDEPEHARSLRRLLFDPIRKALGTTKHYFLVPDGELSRLPFEALPTDNGGLLIDECQVSYLGSGRDVLRFAESPPRPGTQSLVIADPDFDLRVMAPAAVGIAETRDRSLSSLAGITFSRLAGSRREGQEVAALLEAEVWLGEDALESRLKKRVCPRILHVATHGFFMHDETTEARKKGGVEHDSTALEPPAWRRNPLVRSGLALAGANTFLHGEQPPPEAEDGILTAEDVSALDLSGTELVVLSACETGLGEIRTGEGVFGLHRAFRIAGAINLILSLWKVPDESTCLLMNIFYKKVKEGRSFAAALYEAKQSLRFHTIEVGHAGSGKRDLVQFDSTEAAAAEHLMVSKTRPSHRPYSHPYYWAAFAFYGG